MKTIGMIGGLGWPSTVEYYRSINQQVNSRLGGDDFARCIIYSVNWGDIRRLRQKQAIDQIFELYLQVSDKLIKSGADCIVICANAPHQFAEELERRISVPLLHIVDATAKAITAQHLSKVGLLGRKMIMEMDFYKDRLAKQGITTIMPAPDEREYIETKILDELMKGLSLPETKQQFLTIIEGLHQSGAEGIVLGCTEIPLIIGQQDTPIPLFDTLELHTRAIVEFILS
jgi:aspartate racemase